MKQHELGFWELNPKPSKAQLAELYNQQYFDSHNFEVKYSDDEFFHKQIPYMEAAYIYNEYNPKIAGKPRFLDIGCGEGFSLKYFSSQDWIVSGTDYSISGVQRHFPELSKNVQVGDTEELIEKMCSEGKTFDLINLNNVLEHLLGPVEVMKNLKKLLSPTGCLRVQVPNDFSALQKHLLNTKLIDKEFWIYHEHMNYFDRDSLKNIFKSTGFSRVEALSDFPIDLNLFNPDTHYINDKSKGRNCHSARINIENFLIRKSTKDFITFRRGCGESGLGRNVIVYGRH